MPSFSRTVVKGKLPLSLLTGWEMIVCSTKGVTNILISVSM